MKGGEPVVRAEGLSKRFGDVQAVRDLGFEVRPGSVFGLLGRNGAGKTTAIRLLLGLLAPDAGRSTVLGEDSLALSRAARRRIGYLSEERLVPEDLPLPYLLRYVSAFFDSWDWRWTEDLSRRLAVPADRPLEKLSAGEKRKAELLLVLAQRPDLLILDDPAVGLDVTVRREFLWGALEIARDEGKAVLFTTHVLTDVERIADVVGIMDRGSMRLVAPLDELKARTKRLVVPLPPGRDPASVRVPGELTRSVEGSDLVVVTNEFGRKIEEDLAREFGSVDIEDINLEEIFCAVVGRPEEEGADEDEALFNPGGGRP